MLIKRKDKFTLSGGISVFQPDFKKITAVYYILAGLSEFPDKAVWAHTGLIAVRSAVQGVAWRVLLKKVFVDRRLWDGLNRRR